MYSQSTWVSNSSITDSLKCPRLYFLKNVYKNERGHKIALIHPSLSLGQSVHEVLEPLAKIRAADRFKQSLLVQYEKVFKQFKGIPGGFTNQAIEDEYYARGEKMLKRVIKNPGPLVNPALRLTSKDELPPRFILSPSDNILLCGKIDWIEYQPLDDSVHIIDFKTGKYDEDENSLQLPIYCLLVKNLQKRKVAKISYWYLERDDVPRQLVLPDIDQSFEKILQLAKNVKKMRTDKSYECKSRGCRYCKPFEAILKRRSQIYRASWIPGYLFIR